MDPFIDFKGRKWYPYQVEFKTPDGTFVFTIHALNFDHAHMVVEELKQTATLQGQITHVESA
jgi:hypothetical protein